MTCDHLLYIDSVEGGQEVRLSEYPSAIAATKRWFDKWKDQGAIHHPSLVLRWESMTDAQLHNDRNSLFKFCPDCGANLETLAAPYTDTAQDTPDAHQ